MSERDQIIAGLKPLFKKARAEGLWFRSSYQDLWFSPDELEAAQAAGRFIWGAVNWTLCDPADRLAQLTREYESARTAMVTFAKRIGQ